MEHFRVLPTDDRAERVSEEQIDLLFQYWLDYDEEIIRKSYREQQIERRNKPSFRKKDLLDLGYTEEQIAEMAGVVE
jgi:2-polyprenyl-3-methyl-5-hydroxy-6-metoxy-1,4-benzoquinol methylase